MRSWLIRCFPATWQARYGDEFLALLEERPLGPYDIADILLGALDARRRSRGAGLDLHQRSQTMSLRIGGIAAIVGAVLVCLIAIGSGSMAGQAFGGGIAILACGALLSLLVAITGLSEYQARSHPALVWTAFAITALGTIAMLVGAFTALIHVGNQDTQLGPVVVGGIAAIAGSALFGIASYRISVPFRGPAVLLVAGPALGVTALLVAMVNVELAYLLMPPAFFTFVAGWFAIGVQAIRIRPSPAVGAVA